MSIRSSVLIAACVIAALSATPAYCGNLTSFYENGTGNESGTPLSVTAITGGGSDFVVPYSGGAKLGDILVYQYGGLIPGDLVRFVADSSSCSDCVDLQYFVLSAGGFESDVSALPAYTSPFQTLTEKSDGSFFFDNGFALTGYASHIAAAVVPEPASWALIIPGLALLGFALRRRRTKNSPI